MKFITPLLVGTSIVLVVCSCGQIKNEKTTSQQQLENAAKSTDSSGLSAAAKIVGQGVLVANGKQVFDQLSQSCQEQTNADDLTESLVSGRAYLTSFIGADIDDFAVSEIETRRLKMGVSGDARYTLNVTGKSRQVLEEYLVQQKSDSESSTTAPGITKATTTTVPNSRLPFDEPTKWYSFVYQDGSWKLNDCDAFLASTGLTTADNK